MTLLNEALGLVMNGHEAIAASVGRTEVWVAPTLPANTAAPVVTGASVVGDTATTSNGTWSGTLPMTFEYRWQFDDAGTPADIVGEDLVGYLTTFDGRIRSGVRASNVLGPADDWAWSDWVDIAADAPLAVFALPNVHLALSEGGRRAAFVGTPGPGLVGNCLSSAPILEPTYLEAELASSTTSGAAGIQVYKGTLTGSLPTDAPFGQWYGQPGATVMLAPTWAVILMAALGLPEQVDPVPLEAIDYAETAARDIYLALRPDGRGWVWSAAGDGWHGGGDPEANTSPSFILMGAGDLLIGGASNHPDSYVRLKDPADYNGAGATGLAGFRQGVAG